MNRHDPDFEAEITFLKIDEGGRKGYAVSGYRPQFFYHGEDHDAIQEFVDKERVYPGETVMVRLSLLHPELLCDHIRVNDRFEIREGLTTVGLGKITRISVISDIVPLSKRGKRIPNYYGLAQNCITSHNDEYERVLITYFNQPCGESYRVITVRWKRRGCISSRRRSPTSCCT